jgi:hypothetical protein
MILARHHEKKRKTFLEIKCSFECAFYFSNHPTNNEEKNALCKSALQSHFENWHMFTYK